MKFRISSEYGVFEEVRNGRMHAGIDLAMPQSTELRSIAEGTVERVLNSDNGLGKAVMIRNDDGTLSIYGHMSDTSAVRVGEHLDAGEIIGLSGNTGHSTGPHLHFAMKNADGQYVDPTPLAEQIDAISGDVPTSFLERMIDRGSVNAIEHADKSIWNIGGISGYVADKTKENVKEWIYSALAAVGEVLAEIISAVALIGGGIGILMWVAGWKKGLPMTSILFVANMLIKYISGGA